MVVWHDFIHCAVFQPFPNWTPIPQRTANVRWDLPPSLPEARFSSFRISAGDRNSAYPPRVVRVFNSLNSSSALNGAVHGSCFGHREDEFNGTTAAEIQT